MSTNLTATDRKWLGHIIASGGVPCGGKVPRRTFKPLARRAPDRGHHAPAARYRVHGRAHLCDRGRLRGVRARDRTGCVVTARDAEELAQHLWGSDTRIGRARRGRKHPRFAVGYCDVDSGRSVTMGTSDVDWESAFANAAKPEIEAQITCKVCAPGHQPGALRKPCDVCGCECWCNR